MDEAVRSLDDGPYRFIICSEEEYDKVNRLARIDHDGTFACYSPEYYFIQWQGIKRGLSRTDSFSYAAEHQEGPSVTFEEFWEMAQNRYPELKELSPQS